MKKQSGLLRRLTALALALCMLAALTAEIFAADTVASGYCGSEGDGKNLTWTLDSEGVLTISGTGRMKDYAMMDSGFESQSTAPWYNYRNQIKQLILSPNITSIGDYAFYAFTGLTGILTIPNGVTSIGWAAFKDCAGFTGSLTIPDSITSIGGAAFNSCSGFDGSLTIPNSVTSIGNFAFNDCYGFTGSLTIPNSVTSIGVYAFADCTGFTGSLTISNSVTSIGDGAFNGCSGFTGNLTIPNSVTSIGDGAFSRCSSFTGSLTIPDSVISIGNFAFNGCTGFTGSLTIPNSVTSIGDYAFAGCTGFTGSLTISNSVTSIGDYAFSDCTGFTGSLTIPNSVTAMGRSAFSRCSGFTGSLTIPNSVTNIGGSTFWKCRRLTSITIPNSVTSIGWAAFAGCTSLISAAFLGNAPQMTRYEFENCAAEFTIYYIPGTTGWTDSSAYDVEKGTWNGYPLKTWDGKTIPEETKTSVPTGKYCIRAIDESGNPVSDATVWWNGSRAVTDENGDAFVDLTTVGEPVIRVVKSEYIEWTNKNSNWKKSDTRFEQVILYPESYGKLKLKYAKISDILDTNLVIQTKVLNLRNDGALIGDLNSGYFDLSCAATDTSAVTGYAVYQNKKEIAKSTDGNFQKLDVRDFVEGGGCFVRVTGANGQTMDTRINLQFAKNSVNEDFKFELKGKKISFAVSDDIPYIGGTTLSFDMPLNAPVFVSATQDKLQFGINFVSKKLEGNSAKTEAEQLEEYKDTIAKIITYGIVKETDKKLLKNFMKQSNKTTFFKTCDVMVCGYAEADIGSKTASGNIVVIIDVKAFKHSYNTVMIIPVTLQIDVKLALETAGSISYRFNTETWNGNISMKPSIKLISLYAKLTRQINSLQKATTCPKYVPLCSQICLSIPTKAAHTAYADAQK